MAGPESKGYDGRMRISLVIPAFNEAAYIGECLDSVERHARGMFDEIIVVDNASTDGTAEVASRHQGVRVIREENKGLTHAREAGLRESSGEYIAYVDADCRLTPGWRAALERDLSRYPDVIVLSGPIRYYDGPWWLKILVIAVQWVLRPVTSAFAGYWVLGGNFVARRSALESVGGFDTDIPFYGEDADIGRRLRSLGRVLFRRDLCVYTSARRLLREGVARTYGRYTINFIWHILFGRSYTLTYTDVRS